VLAAGIAGALAALCAAPAAGQVRVRLDQVNARRGPDFAPSLEGRQVIISGTVAAPAIALGGYGHVGVQDDDGNGAVVEGALRLVSALRPGDRISVRGVVARRSGLPVVAAGEVNVTGHGPAPAARKMPVRTVQSFTSMGLLVTTEGRLLERGEVENSGEYLLIGDQSNPLRVFLPQPAGRAGAPVFAHVEAGDTVRVTGIASQRAAGPPYAGGFQLLVLNGDAVELVQKRWLVSPATFAFCVAALGLALVFWWSRERRMSAQRRMVRSFYGIGEEIIAAASPADIVRKINAALCPALKIGGVHAYLYDRAAKTLDRVQASPDALPFSVPVFGPEGSLPPGPAAAFRNQALMTIPDTRRSPFFPDQRPEGQPLSVMLIPMFAETALVGVLELYSSRRMSDFNADEKILAQHLANQVAIALRLMEEKSIREQLFRSEKLAAMGRLISGVAEELRAPIENISRLSEAVAREVVGPAAADLRAILSESSRAAEIVARLVSFMQPARSEAKRIDLNALIRNLLEFRADQWRERGITIRQALCPQAIFIVGSQGQLERVILDLLVQAEQMLAEEPQKTISISTGVLARRALVEIGYALNPLKSAAESGAEALFGTAGESVTRGIVHSHGGDIRMVRSRDGGCRIEVELPVVAAGAAEASRTAGRRHLTCLVVEPDRDCAGELTDLLTSAGCRVIPAGAAEAALELVQRMRFDAVFCGIALPGLNWVEFAEIIRPMIGGFVLLTEGFDWELSRGLVSGDSFVLSKPIRQEELERVLNGIEQRAAEGRGPQIVHPFPAVKRAGR